uniref:Alpha/beta hydrolase fold-3 domain-containing protein n=1 Tax=Oryza brachyantha TaxID=4533 RepID=J3LYD5_ORYBR
MSDAGAAADEVVHDFAPLIVVYRRARPLAMPPVPPGTDAATGVVSRDVHLSASSFVRLYLPPPGAAGGGGEKLPLLESEGVGHVFYLFDPAHAKAGELLRRIAAFIGSK